MTYNILRFDKVKSTNALCKQLALEGATEGLVVVAASQTAGRGRLDRKWDSPSGGLWFSLLLRPELSAGDAPLLTMAAAVTVAEAICETTGLEARLKWPNDCLVGGKKVSGILAEGCVSAPLDTFAVVGVGINVNNSFDHVSREKFAVPPASLCEILGYEVGLNGVLNKFLSLFEQEYARLRSGRRPELADHWIKLSATLGKRVRLMIGAAHEPPVEGLAESIDEDFALLVRASNGSLVRVLAGDCIHASCPGLFTNPGEMPTACPSS
jgi:BirA family biotin operon repressor/biotin-[acetyl-CoA-carboxylase] ligase